MRGSTGLGEGPEPNLGLDGNGVRMLRALASRRDDDRADGLLGGLYPIEAAPPASPLSRRCRCIRARRLDRAKEPLATCQFGSPVSWAVASQSLIVAVQWPL